MYKSSLSTQFYSPVKHLHKLCAANISVKSHVTVQTELTLIRPPIKGKSAQTFLISII